MYFDIRIRRGVLLLLFAVVHYARAENYNYALQVEPVTFQEEPQSRTVLANSTVTFTCKARVEPLISGYHLPTIGWRHNGGDIIHKWNTTPKPSNWRMPDGLPLGYSEITIESVTLEDVGYYECLALDGEIEGTDSLLQPDRTKSTWNYITVSGKAWLDIITVSPVPLHQTEEVNSSEPLLLPCQIGASHPPQRVQWYKDETLLNSTGAEWVLLSNGGLLVFSSSETTTGGSYYCIAWLEGQPFNSTTFEVSTSQDHYTGSPQVFADPTQVTGIAGEPLSLVCYVAGLSNSSYRVRWFDNNGMVFNSDKLSISEATTDNTSVYICEVIAGGETYTATSYVTVTVSPSIIATKPVQELLINPGDSITIPCSFTGQPLIYWYKDGVNVTDDANATSGELIVEGDIASIVGVYQCFAENSAGSAYAITRVLRDGFANPPGNITCRAVLDKSVQTNAVLDWIPPRLYRSSLLEGNNVSAALYTVSLRDAIGEEKNAPRKLSNPHYEHKLSAEGSYTFYVRVELPTSELMMSAAATCTVNSWEIEETYPVTVSCDTDTVEITWINPALALYVISLDELDLSAICIYGNTTKEFHCSTPDGCYNGDYVYEYADLYEDSEIPFGGEISGVPLGAVCQFEGSYGYGEPASGDIKTITPATCNVPLDASPTNDLVQLGISCDSSQATVSWYTDPTDCYKVQNITITGRCLSRNESQWKYPANTTPDLAGIMTMVDIPSNAICSFYGFYYSLSEEQVDINPVQCVMGKPVEDHYELLHSSLVSEYRNCNIQPTSTDALSATPTPTNTFTTENVITPASNEDTSKDLGYLWFVVSCSILFVMIGGVLLLLLLLCYCNECRHSHRVSREREEDVKFVALQLGRTKHWEAPITDLYSYEETASEVNTICEPIYRPELSMIGGISQQSIATFGSDLQLEEDGKMKILDKFLKSQQPETWSNSDPTLLSPTVETPNAASDGICDEEVHVETGTTLEFIAPNTHRLIQVVNSGASSSGYATDSCFLSDTSCSYPTNYLQSRLRQLEDLSSLSENVEEMGTLFTPSLSVDMALHVKQNLSVNKGKTKTTRSREHPRFTDNRAESPLSDTTDYSRSLHMSAYSAYTDDEGYVHMGSAGHVDIPIPGSVNVSGSV